jgi:hypothetical protein
VNLDRDLFLVISDIGDGPIILGVDNLADMSAAKVTRDILSGQYSTPLAVIQINVSEKICRDCTHDFQTVIDDHAEAVADARRDRG